MTFSVPVICLVTDRGRLSRPTDDDLVCLAASSAAAGVDLIHLRERDREARALVVLARRMVAATSGSRTRVVVNDRADVAMAAGAGGVHLRADSAAADRVRAMSPRGFIVGRSVHSAAEAVRAAETGVDYLVMGTVYRTKSKEPTAPLAGIRGLEEVCRSVSVPVLAIGGITIDTLGDIAAAGAAGIAAIGLFSETFNDNGHEGLDAALEALVETIRRGFTPQPR
jgi:thiamine-phosphate diphosphorylase